MKNTDQNIFVQAKDNDGEVYLCPINEVNNVNFESIEVTDECFEKNVAERYAGGIEIVTR